MFGWDEESEQPTDAPAGLLERVERHIAGGEESEESEEHSDGSDDD